MSSPSQGKKDNGKKKKKGSRLRLKQKLEADAEANSLVGLLFGEVKKQMHKGRGGHTGMHVSSAPVFAEDATLAGGGVSSEEEDERLFGGLGVEVNEQASLWGHMSAPPTQSPSSKLEVKKSGSKAALQRPSSAIGGRTISSASSGKRKQTTQERDMQQSLQNQLDQRFVDNTNAMIDNLILEDYDFEESSSDESLDSGWAQQQQRVRATAPEKKRPLITAQRKAPSEQQQQQQLQRRVVMDRRQAGQGSSRQPLCMSRTSPSKPHRQQQQRFPMSAPKSSSSHSNSHPSSPSPAPPMFPPLSSSSQPKFGGKPRRFG
jgi:hypothetical protein